MHWVLTEPRSLDCARAAARARVRVPVSRPQSPALRWSLGRRETAQNWTRIGFRLFEVECGHYVPSHSINTRSRKWLSLVKP
jgi:hypothetical protein